MRTSFPKLALVLLSLAASGCPGGYLGELKSLDITPGEIVIPAGERRILLAMGTFEDGSREDLSSLVDWTTSDASIVALSPVPGEEGTVFAVANGEATITAKDPVTGRSAKAQVTVSSATLRSFRIEPFKTGVPKGAQWTFTAVGTYSDGSTGTLDGVAWESSNPAVIAVTAEGEAEALRQGQATITASHASAGAVTLEMDVFDANLVSLKISSEVEAIGFEKSAQLYAHGTFTDGSVRDITQWVDWSVVSSADSDKLSISNTWPTKGRMTGGSKEGSVSVSASFGSLSDTAQVPVVCTTQPLYPAAFPGGTGTAQNPYWVCRPEDLDLVNYVPSSHVVLKKDIDMTQGAFLMIAQGFRGVLDGAGHTISNYVQPSTSRGGLFDTLAATAVVRNLTLKDFVVSGRTAVGTLAAVSVGTIENVHVVNATVTGGESVGGLVGYLSTSGTIRRSSVQGGSIRGQAGVGGLAGECAGTIENTFSTANVDFAILPGYSSAQGAIGGLVGRTFLGASIFHSYAAGMVTVPDSILSNSGGLLGMEGDGSVTQSYWDIEASGINRSAAGGGYSTEQMRKKSSFPGWDFETVWTIEEDVSYPTLR